MKTIQNLLLEEIKYIQEAIPLVKKENFNPIMFLDSRYFRIATLLINDNDNRPNRILDARKYLFKAAYITHLLFEISCEKRYPYFKKFIDINVGINNEKTLPSAINCGDEEFLKKFVSEIDYFSVRDNEKHYSFIATMLKKAMILNDDERLEYFKNKLFIQKYNINGYSLGDFNCLQAIFENDIEKYNLGINQIIKAYKREAARQIYNEISFGATAMVKFGLRFGLNADMSSSYISKELVFTENISFEEDEELIKINKKLDKIDKSTRGGIWNKIFR